MKVLLVNGSPHQHGCTDRALQEVQASLVAEGVVADIFWIENKPIAGCLSCGLCAKNQACVYDDVVNNFINIAKFYDGFVFGSPVYFASASGQMKAFMDRVFFASNNAKNGIFDHKPAASVASCRRAGDVAALDQLNKYYGLNITACSTCRWLALLIGRKCTGTPRPRWSRIWRAFGPCAIWARIWPGCSNALKRGAAKKLRSRRWKPARQPILSVRNKKSLVSIL